MGQTGKVVTVFGNGVMVERDTKETRRFTTVTFNNLELSKE